MSAKKTTSNDDQTTSTYDEVSFKEGDTSPTKPKEPFKGGRKDPPPVAPKPPILGPKPVQRSFNRTVPKSQESPSTRRYTQVSQNFPKEPGTYYFDGTTFESIPYDENDPFRSIYVPGSDFLEVTGPSSAIITQVGDKPDEESVSDVTSGESDLEPPSDLHTDEVISSNANVTQNTKGIQALNITIKLNLSDIVRQGAKRVEKKKSSRSGRKSRPASSLPTVTGTGSLHGSQSKTDGKQADFPDGLENSNENRKLPRLRRKPSIYTEIDESDLVDKKTEVTELLSQNVERDELETAPPVLPKRSATRQPPLVPPRNPPPRNHKGLSQSPDASSENDEDGYQKYQVRDQPSPDTLRGSDKQLEELSNDNTITEGQKPPSGLSNKDTVFSTNTDKQSLPGKADSIYACLVKDHHIKKEVESIKNMPWFYMYVKKKEVKRKLLDNKDQDGRFALICENIQRECVHQFTLLVVKDGDIHKLQIRKVLDHGRPLYHISDDRKSHKHLNEFIDHYLKNKLPYLNVKLLPWTEKGWI